MATSRKKKKLAAVSRETPESTRNSRAQNTLATESIQAEKEIEPGNVLSKGKGSVAARLRSLRTDDLFSKGHPMFINQELEL